MLLVFVSELSYPSSIITNVAERTIASAYLQAQCLEPCPAQPSISHVNCCTGSSSQWSYVIPRLPWLSRLLLTQMTPTPWSYSPSGSQTWTKNLGVCLFRLCRYRGTRGRQLYSGASYGALLYRTGGSTVPTVTDQINKYLYFQPLSTLYQTECPPCLSLFVLKLWLLGCMKQYQVMIIVNLNTVDWIMMVPIRVLIYQWLLFCVIPSCGVLKRPVLSIIRAHLCRFKKNNIYSGYVLIIFHWSCHIILL